MPRESSPYVIYRSTREQDVERAAAILDAHYEMERAKGMQPANEADVAALLILYWRERGQRLINSDQTERSIRTFLAFLMQDDVGIRAVVSDLNRALFERFREWRMGPHGFELDWNGTVLTYASEGVSGSTVQRNVNDIRAAVHYAEENRRIPHAPRIRDVGSATKARTRTAF